jgi:hypothetical protein
MRPLEQSNDRGKLISSITRKGMQLVAKLMGLALATLSFHWERTHDRPSLAVTRHAKITNLHELSDYCAPGTKPSPNQLKRSSLLSGFIQSFKSTPHIALEYDRSRLVIGTFCSGKIVLQIRRLHGAFDTRDVPLYERIA